MVTFKYHQYQMLGFHLVIEKDPSLMMYKYVQSIPHTRMCDLKLKHAHKQSNSKIFILLVHMILSIHYYNYNWRLFRLFKNAKFIQDEDLGNR